MILALLLFAATQKLAMVGFVQGAGIDDASFRAIVDTIAGEVRKVSGAGLITTDEIKTVLSAEEQKQLLGCTSESCFAEIGSAMGAERILTGSIGKAGTSLVLVIKTVHSRSAEVKQTTKRFKGGTVDDVLDAIPEEVRSLFGSAAPANANAASATPTGAPFDRERWAKSQPIADAENIRRRVRVFGDNKGHYLAIEPKTGTSALAFFGDSKGLYEQRFESASKNGPALGYVFWEPRITDGWQRSITVTDSQAEIQCGDSKVVYRLLGSKDASLIASTPLLQPLMRSREIALAADASGVYYYVDRDRAAKPGTGYRLFIGKRGSVSEVPVDDVVSGDKSTSYVTSQGSLVFSEKANEKTAEWSDGRSALKLQPANLYLKAPWVFRELGVYPTRLQTPCD